MRNSKSNRQSGSIGGVILIILTLILIARVAYLLGAGKLNIFPGTGNNKDTLVTTETNSGTQVVNNNTSTNRPTNTVSGRPLGWLGLYEFTESVSGNASQVWVYRILIAQVSGKWKVLLNVDGSQTLTRIVATARDAGDSMDVIFDSYDKGNQGGTFKKGDVLFTLTRSSSGLSIQWKTMQPNLEKNREGSRFTLLKNI